MCKLNLPHHPEQGAFDFNIQHLFKKIKSKICCKSQETSYMSSQ